ncbi:type VII secretion protein EccB [Streptomyces sp. NPDC091272]|uniref:type VII secretion protein EccB n=1 Tax=Streptomyces sp. NPDC091272 TaxID=3365981 RepID=UPI00380C50E9
MASRRDELNAYTFAKRRLVAQFLRPSPTGSEEGAPRPMRAVLPGLLVGAVVLAVFGAWGMFRPTAPRDWAKTRTNIIVAGGSTARYVVLEADGVRKLHPVLNMASARLLIDVSQGGVVKVDDRILDEKGPPRGATLGIPYAPDRLPEPDAAVAPKSWAVCERPGRGGGGGVQRAVFVLSGKDRDALESPNRLRGDQILYVEGPGHVRYVVDAAGTAYRLGSDPALLTQVVGPGRVPQQVSDRWLATLPKAGPITSPLPGGKLAAPTPEPRVQAPLNRVGTVLVTGVAGNRHQHYLVLPDRIAPVTDLMAKLITNSANRTLRALHPGGRPHPASAGFAPGAPYLPPGGAKWPASTSGAVNSPSAAPGSRNTVCSLLGAVDPTTGRITLRTWAGTGFPKPLPTAADPVYVTAGSGQYFRQFKGAQPRTGTDYLLTDTGLRHAMQSNGDTARGTVRATGGAAERPKSAAELLGYGEKRPAPVPAAWADLLPKGPRLSTGAAQQPQGS